MKRKRSSTCEQDQFCESEKLKARPKAEPLEIMDHSDKENERSETDIIDDQDQAVTPLFACKVCKKQYRKKDRVEQHFLTVHAGVRYRCHICDFIAIREGNILRHATSKHKPHRSQNCRQCQEPKEFRIPSLSKAVKTKDIDQTKSMLYKCHVCDQVFSNDYSIKDHIRRHHSHEAVSIDEDSEIIEENIINDAINSNPKVDEAQITVMNQPELTSDNDGSDFQCKKCPKGFESRLDLMQHDNFDHRGLPCFQCKVCGRKFVQESSLDKHMKILHDEEDEDIDGGDSDKENGPKMPRLQCKGCDRVFKLKIQLNKHSKTCTN